MQQVQNVLQQELGGFQNKLQGCMRRCQEAAQVRERCQRATRCVSKFKLAPTRL
jgi:hypothetical protein